jgi:gas vesicle protein
MRDMTTTSTQARIAGTLGVLLLGGAAGFVAGWLSAPASGRETRRRIGRRLDDERHDALRRGQRVINRTLDRVEQGLESSRRRLNRTFAA